MKPLTAMLLLMLAATAPAAPPAPPPRAFDALLENAESFWQRPRDAWLRGPSASWFRAVTDAPTGDLRYPGYSNSPALSFLGMRVYELILHFGSGAFDDASLSLYNRGDAGEIPQADFAAKVAAAEQALTTRFGRPNQTSPDRELGRGLRVENRLWQTPEFAIELISGTTRDSATKSARGFRAEYIEIRLSRGTAMRASVASPAANRLSGSAAAIRRNVARDDDGYAFVQGLPMVDQGQRGYCAVATAERLLRYYGEDVDQHMLAQMADTNTGGGTSPEVMLDVLRKAGMRFGVKARIYEEQSPKKLLSLLNKYNSVARRERAPELPLPRGGVIYVDRVYAAMNPAILRRARCERDGAGLKSFRADIAKCVDQGIPLAWSVMLGILREPDIPQAAGGHMRIIFGYNRKADTLLYTDSWGAGHERKTMSIQDAWTITTGLYSLEPRH